MDSQRVYDELRASPNFLLSRVGTAVQTGFRELLAGFRLRPLEYLILRLLASGEGSSQQELCRAAGVDSGNMVEFLDRLEALGYAQRTRHPRDRRRHIVTITRAGRGVVTRINRATGEYDERFLSPLSAEERATLTGILGKLFATTDEGRLPTLDR